MKTRKMQRNFNTSLGAEHQARKRAKLTYNNQQQHQQRSNHINPANHQNLPSSIVNTSRATINNINHNYNNNNNNNNNTALNQGVAFGEGDHFRIQQKDKVEKKVELIFKDAQNNNYNSLTIWGTGLDVERTIGVVEELKRIYVKHGKNYNQETYIKTDDNNEPHLQVILTMLDNNDADNSGAASSGAGHILMNDNINENNHGIQDDNIDMFNNNNLLADDDDDIIDDDDDDPDNGGANNCEINF